MSTLTALDKARAASYVMPQPHDGQTVLWFPHGIRDSGEYPHFPAVVIKKGFNSVELNILRPDAKPLHMLGVRHIDDPNVREFQTAEVGAWDYTDWDKYIMQMVERHNALVERVVKKAQT